nr:hypothetical protein [uncultured Pseudomonas sp.]
MDRYRLLFSSCLPAAGRIKEVLFPFLFLLPGSMFPFAFGVLVGRGFPDLFFSVLQASIL